MASTPSTSRSEPFAADSGSTSLEAERRRLTLLAVDDSASDLKILARAVAGITDWQAELHTCLGPAECLALLETRAVDVLLIDYSLGSVSGIELLREIRQGGTLCPVIFLTGRGDIRAAVQALQAGAADFMTKEDLSGASLKRAVEGAIEKRNLQLALTDYRKRLERAKESLERRNAEIQSFYRTITQELTTPLGNALELLSGLVDGERGPLAAEQAEAVQAVKDSCSQIALCIDDVLDMGRLEAGKISVWIEPDDLADVLQRAAATFSARAASLGVHLEMRVDPALAPALIDRHRITQALSNLVERALEFTPAGGRIEIEANEDPCDAAFLSVSVVDSGPGMPPEEVSRLATAFCRNDGSAGANLRRDHDRGLALCHEIVRLHGGEITIASEVGSGTTFSFTLPKAPARDMAA